VHRSTFFNIADALTSGDAVARKAVDYVVGLLVNDAADAISRIINHADMHDWEKEGWISNLEQVTTYLKYGFDSRVEDLSLPPCLLHDITHGLNNSSDDDIEDAAICEECLSLFCFFHSLEKRMIELGSLSSTAEVVRECGEKAKLFLGHRIRVIKQQRAIRKTLNDIRDRCMVNRTTSEAVVTLDYKMKLEPLYYREKTSDHYGKRGMSWHGAMVQYFASRLRR
jgi:hypothetical protein